VARALAASMRVELPRPAATKAPIYEGSNFSLWLLRFETWAKVQGLWAFFRGAVPRPTEPTNANAASFQDLQAAMQRVQLHDSKADRAFEALVSAMVKPDNLRIIMAFRGRNGQPPRPDLAWQRLKTAHIVQQQTTFLVVSREMANLKMDRGEAISAYWARAQDIKERCLDVDVPMPPKVFLSSVLNGLPKSWGPLIMIESRQLDTLTEDLLLSSLEQEEQRRGQDKGQGHGEAYLGGGRSFSPKGRGRPGPKWAGGKDAKVKKLGEDGAWGNWDQPRQTSVTGAMSRGTNGGSASSAQGRQSRSTSSSTCRGRGAPGGGGQTTRGRGLPGGMARSSWLWL